MINNQMALEKPLGKLSSFFHHPLSRIIFETVILFGGLFVLKITVIKPGLSVLGVEEPVFKALQGIITLAVMFVVYVVLIRSYERRRVYELPLAQLVPDGLIGALSAVGMVSIVFTILWLAGAWYVVSTGSISEMFIPLVWVLVLATLEELIFRGIVYRILEEWLGTILALTISAGLFGGVHIFNENANLISVVSAAAGGLLMGALYSLTGRLWIPIFFHSFWNFTQAMFGSVVSGTDIFGTYLESVREGPDWLTGGPFGIENSLLVIGFILVVVGMLFARMKKQDRFLKGGISATR